MTILDAVRDRLSTRDAQERLESRASESTTEPAAATNAPFDGYERVNDREVMDSLGKHSQAGGATAGIPAHERKEAMTTGISNPSINLRLVELSAEAQYARERYRIYRAKAYGPRPTSPQRLRELEKRSNWAEARLDRARGEQELLTARP